MKFCSRRPIKWLVLLILIQNVYEVNTASTQGKCENCTNLQELSLALAILGIVSLLFITLCLCRCLPKFTAIMFGGGVEQLNAHHRAQQTERLSQILKRQQLAQLARQSSNLNPEQRNNLLEKGLFQDPFLGAGVLGSILLTPSRLSTVHPSTLNDEKQQVNGGLTLNKTKVANDINEIKTTPTNQKSKRIHPAASFSVAAQAAVAATHMLHQQRTNTLRKQVAKRNLEQKKQCKLKDASFSSSFDQSQDQSIDTSASRFLKKSTNTVNKPVQLQHSLSLTSFAGTQFANRNVSNGLNGRLNTKASSNQFKIDNSPKDLKRPIKYSGIDKNIMTIDQQPITFESIYDRQTNVNQSRQFYSNRQELDAQDSKLIEDHLFSKSPQNIEQPIRWLDQEMIDTEDLDDLPLPAPLPPDLLDDTSKNKRRLHSPIEFTKSRSMPMLIDQQNALYNPYYMEVGDHHLHDQLDTDTDTYGAFNETAFQYRNNYNQSNFVGEETCSLHRNTQNNEYIYPPSQQDQRRFVNLSGSNQQIADWPDVQLQHFLNAYNHYTQRTMNRNHTRSLFDLY